VASISPYDPIRSPAPLPPRHSLLKRAFDLDEAGGDASQIPPPPVHFPNAVDYSDARPDATEDPEAPVNINEPTNHERWEGGFSFLPESNGDGVIWVPCGTSNTSAVTDADAIQSYVPTVVQVSVKRSSWNFQVIDFKGRSARFLDLVSHRDTAAEFWFGTKAQAETLPNNYLTKAGFTDLGTATNATDALSELQTYITGTASGGGWGFIHTSPRVLNEWLDLRLVHACLDDLENICYHDAFGNEIIVSPGYPTTVNGSSNWEAYATGPVYGKLGGMMLVPQDIKAALNRSNNTIEYRAERFWALVWDGAQHAKVQVSLS